jgi:TolB-like protein
MRDTKWWATIIAAAALSTSSVGVLAGPKSGERSPAERPPILAVLPFKVLNQEPSLAHYGEGAADAVINKVVNDKTLKVVEESQLDKAIKLLSRSQSGLFEEESALQVGQMVDARYIVVGSVQIVGVDGAGSTANAQLKVNARVLEVETRQLLVSESVFGPIAGAFQHYEEIGARLVAKITAHLAERANGASADTVAVDQLIADGKHFDPAFPVVAGVRKELSKAIEFYKKAVVRDPRSPRAFVAVGHAELRLSEALQRDDPTRSRALVVDARDHLAKSVELQGDNAFTLTQLGRAEGKLGRHSQARFAFERALAIDSAFIDARYGLVVALLAEGQLSAAKEQALLAKAAGDPRADGLLSTIDERLAAQRPRPTPAATK